MVLRSFKYLLIALGASATVIFGFVWYDRNYRLRDCFNEQGRCFDADSGIVFLEQAGMIWLLLASIAGLITALLAYRVFRRDR